MITLEKIKEIYGETSILLFKGREPFTEVVKDIPQGVLIQKEGKVVCFECKKTFHLLGPHLIKAHNMEVRDYKIKYGFNMGAAMCSDDYSKKRSYVASENNKTPKMKEYHCKKLIDNLEKTRNLKSRERKAATMQEKNSNNTCDEQIKKRIELLKAKIGDKLPIHEVIKYDSGVYGYAIRYFKTWNAFKKNFDLPITDLYQKKNKADLIYDLRDFVDKNGSLPFKKDKKSFPHSHKAYINHFGSMLRAYKECGIVVNGGRGTNRSAYILK